MRVRTLLRSAVCASALMALSCGGSDGGGSSTPGPSPTPPPSTPQPTAISILGDRGDQSFNPNPVPAPASGTVTWVNNNGEVHRIVANDGSFDTGNIAPGASSSAIQVPAGGINYHCSLHPGMVGAVNDSGNTTPPCTGLYC